MDCVRAAGLEIIMSHERLVPGHTWTTLMPEGYWCGYVGQGMVRCALSDRGGECCARADSLMVLHCPPAVEQTRTAGTTGGLSARPCPPFSVF
ncbi:hypothetical protein [Pararhodospirillum photometricum]|uniref:hypothetical protein n=1 Tax=Pararhodospirillum photometricum TaxID=1084 RepID=UPI0002E4ED3E|nr:hypothetical protein [Pararhodospirillum photometricum]